MKPICKRSCIIACHTSSRYNCYFAFSSLRTILSTPYCRKYYDILTMPAFYPDQSSGRVGSLTHSVQRKSEYLNLPPRAVRRGKRYRGARQSSLSPLISKVKLACHFAGAGHVSLCQCSSPRGGGRVPQRMEVFMVSRASLCGRARDSKTGCTGTTVVELEDDGYNTPG
ncbi:hypothetical protein BDV19DRAFT_362127 [Aspergillus venezuelensis]